MKILVTGANGFVGLHLIERLLSEGHEVYGLVRSIHKIKIEHPNLHLIEANLSNINKSWQNNLPTEIDIIIHTAGLVHSYVLQDFYDANTLGTENLIKVLKNKYLNPIKFILISSLAVMGPSKKGEKKFLSDKAMPVSTYGVSKKLAEEYLVSTRPDYWTTIIIRPPMVIGPRDEAVLDIFKMVRDGVIILPDIKARKKEYSFVCVFDLVETIMLSMKCTQNSIFYSANPEIITFEELIKTIQDEMNKKNIFYLPLPALVTKAAAHALSIANQIYPHKLRLTPDKIHELLPDAWICDSSESAKQLGQTFQYSVAETIKITYKDYKLNSKL